MSKGPSTSFSRRPGRLGYSASLRPENAAGRPSEGGKVHPLDVKAGDRVLFGKWSGTEVKIDGEELMIMKESDVMGIVDSGAAAGNKM